MSREYRNDEEAARAKIAALEADLREHETKLSSLLFSRTPAGAFAPMRARTLERLEPSRLERNFNLLFAVIVAIGCRWLGAGPILTLMLGALAYFVFWQVATAVRGLIAHSRSSPPPERSPEEVAALAALVEDRNARIETLNSQIAKERAACDELRKRIQETDALLDDDSIKNRESSR